MKTKLSIAVLAATLSSVAFAAQDSDTIEAVERTTETVTAALPDQSLGQDGPTLGGTIDAVVDAALDTSLSELNEMASGGSFDDPTAGLFTEEGLGGVSISEGVDQALFIISQEVLMDDRDLLDSNLDNIVDVANAAVGTVLGAPAGVTEAIGQAFSNDGGDPRNRFDTVVDSVAAPVTGTAAIVAGGAGIIGGDVEEIAGSVVSAVTGLPETEQPSADDLPLGGGEETPTAPTEKLNPATVDVVVNGSVQELPEGCDVTTDTVTFEFPTIAQSERVGSYTTDADQDILVTGCSDAGIRISTSDNFADSSANGTTDVDLLFKGAGEDEFTARENFRANLTALADEKDPFSEKVSTRQKDSGDKDGNGDPIFIEGTLEISLKASIDGDMVRQLGVGEFQQADNETIFVFIEGEADESSSTNPSQPDDSSPVPGVDGNVPSIEMASL